jgi:hypothetical protein
MRSFLPAKSLLSPESLIFSESSLLSQWAQISMTCVLFRARKRPFLQKRSSEGHAAALPLAARGQRIQECSFRDIQAVQTDPSVDGSVVRGAPGIN